METANSSGKYRFWYLLSFLAFAPPTVALGQVYSRGYSNIASFSLIWSGVVMCLIVTVAEVAASNLHPDGKTLSQSLFTLVLFAAGMWLIPGFLGLQRPDFSEMYPLIYAFGGLLCASNLHAAVRRIAARSKKNSSGLNN